MRRKAHGIEVGEAQFFDGKGSLGSLKEGGEDQCLEERRDGSDLLEWVGGRGGIIEWKEGTRSGREEGGRFIG